MKTLVKLGTASEITRGSLCSTIHTDSSKITINGVKYRAQKDNAPLPPQYPIVCTPDPM